MLFSSMYHSCRQKALVSKAPEPEARIKGLRVPPFMVVAGLVLVVLMAGGCDHNGGPVVFTPTPTVWDEGGDKGVAPPPPSHTVEGSGYTRDYASDYATGNVNGDIGGGVGGNAETTAPETAVANTSLDGTAPVSNAEAEWRKMLEPYLSDRTTTSAAPVTTPAREPVLMSLTGGTVRVGILLPLSGPSAAVGKDMLNAAQMALFDFADADFELLPQDTAGQPEEASFAATLAIGDGASLMVGPLLSRSTHAIGPISRASGVPVIAFSSDSSVAGEGVYTLGFLPRNEVDRVTAYALGQGLRNFVVLAPDDPYGRSVVQSLSAYLNRAGGNLIETAFYDRNGHNIEEVVKQLADYDNRRLAFLQERELLEDKEDELSKKALKRLELSETLGELPYDALFIADGGDRLLQVAALLPFYDIDPRKVQILGTGQWDVAGIGAEPALLGSWFAAPPPQARDKFQHRYEHIYGSPPHRLATLAYDATALAAVLARKGSAYPYAPESIMQTSGFSGRDGVFRFAPDGTADRALAVLEVRQRDNVTIDPPPAGFAADTN